MTDLALPWQGTVAASMLFVHGDFGDGLESWSKPVQEIGRRGHLLVADRPGFGETISSEARFSIANDAEYLLEAAADAGLDSFHLIGHSYGALVALEMGIRRPRRVRTLHLIEPPLLDLLPEDPLVRQMDRRVREIQDEYLRAGDEATTEAFFSMIGAHHVIERLQGSPDWERLCGYAPRFARSEPVGDYARSALQRLSRDLPVALYTGGLSHPALRALVFALGARLHGARVVDVPSAGHAVQMSGAAFIEPLLESVLDAEAAWPSRASVPSGHDAGK